MPSASKSTLKPGGKPPGVKLRRETRGTSSSRKRLAIKIAKWSLLGILLVGAIGAAGLAGMFWFYGSDPKLPKIGQLADYKPKQVTRIYTADGKLIGELFEERRTYVPLERVAPAMVNAMVDAEDERFFEHSGLDFTGMVRALYVNLRSGQTRQGASTITQQVVKTFLLTPERTLRRKVQEIILARRLEDALSKEEILTLYLNQIYFGHGRYGIEEAARYFFGKSAAELSVGEAALLAGLPQSPERLSPIKNPEAAKGRQTYVLRQMVDNGHLEEAEAQKWIDAPIRLVKDPDPALGAAPEVVDLVKQELLARLGPQALATAGLTVRTTIDLELQEAAREALAAGLMTIDQRHGYRGPLGKVAGDKKDKKLAQLKKELGGKAPDPTRSHEAVVVSVDDEKAELIVDLGGWRGAVLLGDAHTEARYNPDKKKPSERFAAGDLVRVRVTTEEKARSEGVAGALLLDQGPQGAVVIIDPRTRQVLALVGGDGFKAGGFNRALKAKRQPGSSFKPYVYAAAIDSGKFTAASVVNDAPEVYDLWKPKNYEANAFRGPVRLRTAMALSINSVAIRVLHDVGPAAVIGLAHALGIKEDLPEELSLALGSGVVTPIDHVNAFASFAAGGVYAPYTVITHVGDEALAPLPSSQALRPETAFVVTSMMESVVDEGTATPAKKLKRRLAGKTGTSNGGRDLWFVGFSPDLVAGVWIGFDDMRRVGRGETGGKSAVPIWVEIMKVGLKTRGAKTFKQPPGVVVARIDKKSGKLAAPGEAGGGVLEEVFLDGTVPTEVAPASNEVDPSTFGVDALDDGGGAGSEAKPGAGGAQDDEAATGASDPIDP